MKEGKERVVVNKTMLSAFARKMSTSCSNIAAVVQLCSTADKAANLAKASRLIEKAVQKMNASAVFLPEAFDFIGENVGQTLEMAETLDGDTIRAYKGLAKKLDVTLSLGGFHENRGGKVRNVHVFIDGNGNIAATYAKAHLFDVEIPGKFRLKESDYVLPGDEIAEPVASPVGKVGLAVCYDMRFPEMGSLLRKNGAEVLTFPSAFTVTTGLAHWETLLRAQAVQNQCYVVAAAQSGRHNAKRSSFGHSMIVDPWGAVVARCGDGENVAAAEIDLDYLERVRRQMPLGEHARNDLYSLKMLTSIEADEGDFNFGRVKIPRNCLIHESRLSVVSVNRKPVLRGHLLVIPKRKSAERLNDLTEEEISDLFLTVQKAQKATETHFGCDSSTVAIQDGKNAGQTIEHLHVHVLPRKGGDFDGRNDEIYDRLEKHDKNVAESDWRSHEDMAKEAELLRRTWEKLNS